MKICTCFICIRQGDILNKMPGFSKVIISHILQLFKKGRACPSLFLYPSGRVVSGLPVQRTHMLCILFLIVPALHFCSSTRQSMVPARLWPHPQEMLSAYNDNFNKLQTFKAKGMLILQSEDFNEKGTVHVVVKMPDSLKILIEGPLGIDIASFFIDNSDYLLYLHRDEIVYSGKLDTLNIGYLLNQLTGISLSDDIVSGNDLQKEIISLFMGISSLKGKPNVSTGNNESDKGINIFLRNDEKYQTVFEFPTDREILQKVRILDQANKEIRVEKIFNRYIKQRGVFYPRRIRYTFFREKSQIALQYQNIQINQKIRPEEFVIKISPGLISRS